MKNGKMTERIEENGKIKERMDMNNKGWID